MRKKNVFTLLLSAVMILMVSLTACSRGDSPASASSSQGNGSTAEESSSSSDGGLTPDSTSMAKGSSLLPDSSLSTDSSSTTKESGSSSGSSMPSNSSAAAPKSSSSVAKSTSQGQPSSEGTSKILVAYFSRVGNTNFSDNVDAISSASLNVRNNGLIGSTEIVARQIHDIVGGDLVEIQTVDPYPVDYQTTVRQNVDEANSGFKPELKTDIKNMDSYDTVYLGYPTWAMDIPRPIASFLSGYDFKGKTVIPFNTNGGYGLGSTVNSIKELCPNSTMLDAFEMPGTDVRDTQGVQRAVSGWLNKIGITK